MSKNLTLIVIAAIVVVMGVGLYIFIGNKEGAGTLRDGEPTRIAIIGYLQILEATNRGLVDGLQKLGYEEGTDFTVEEYWAEGNFEKMVADSKNIIENDLADVLVGNPGEGAMAALQAAEELNSQIPIMYMTSFDPIKMGLIENFRASGNNVTGVAVDLPSLTAKRLDFLRKIAPEAKKLGIVYGTFNDITSNTGLEQMREQAPNFGFELVEYVVDAPPGPQGDAAVTAVINSIRPGEFDAFYRMLGPVTSSPAALAAYPKMTERVGVPSVFWGNEPGSTFNYDADYYEIGVQAATVLAKILDGTAPGDIPSEYARENVLEVNLINAKRAGVTVPDSIISIADRVVD